MHACGSVSIVMVLRLAAQSRSSALKQLPLVNDNYSPSMHLGQAFTHVYELIKNWFMLIVRISSYGCTWEVWRARKKRKSLAS